MTGIAFPNLDMSNFLKGKRWLYYLLPLGERGLRCGTHTHTYIYIYIYIYWHTYSSNLFRSHKEKKGHKDKDMHTQRVRLWGAEQRPQMIPLHTFEEKNRCESQEENVFLCKLNSIDISIRGNKTNRAKDELLLEIKKECLSLLHRRRYIRMEK